jgi:hypothetical protein
MSERCFRCGALPTAAPFTPATFWRGRSLPVWLCPRCLHDSAGILLYRFDRERWQAQTPDEHTRWLASLLPEDRSAFTGGAS